jgi:hypothetical protein
MKVWNSLTSNKIIDETIKKAKEKTKKAIFGEAKETEGSKSQFDIDAFYDRIV